QLGRREDLPRGGRGGAEDAPRRGGRAGRWRFRRPLGQRRDRRRAAAPRRRDRRGEAARPREGQARGIQGTEEGLRRARDVPRPEWEGRLQVRAGIRREAVRLVKRAALVLLLLTLAAGARAADDPDKIAQEIGGKCTDAF